MTTYPRAQPILATARQGGSPLGGPGPRGLPSSPAREGEITRATPSLTVMELSWAQNPPPRRDWSAPSRSRDEKENYRKINAHLQLRRARTRLDSAFGSRSAKVSTTNGALDNISVTPARPATAAATTTGGRNDNLDWKADQKRPGYMQSTFAFKQKLGIFLQTDVRLSQIGGASGDTGYRRIAFALREESNGDLKRGKSEENDSKNVLRREETIAKDSSDSYNRGISAGETARLRRFESSNDSSKHKKNGTARDQERQVSSDLLGGASSRCDDNNESFLVTVLRLESAKASRRSSTTISDTQDTPHDVIMPAQRRQRSLVDPPQPALTSPTPSNRLQLPARRVTRTNSVSLIRSAASKPAPASSPLDGELMENGRKGGGRGELPSIGRPWRGVAGESRRSSAEGTGSSTANRSSGEGHYEPNRPGDVTNLTRVESLVRPTPHRIVPPHPDLSVPLSRRESVGYQSASPLNRSPGGTRDADDVFLTATPAHEVAVQRKSNNSLASLNRSNHDQRESIKPTSNVIGNKERGETRPLSISGSNKPALLRTPGFDYDASSGGRRYESNSSGSNYDRNGGRVPRDDGTPGTSGVNRLNSDRNGGRVPRDDGTPGTSGVNRLNSGSPRHVTRAEAKASGLSYSKTSANLQQLARFGERQKTGGLDGVAARNAANLRGVDTARLTQSGDKQRSQRGQTLTSNAKASATGGRKPLLRYRSQPSLLHPSGSLNFAPHPSSDDDPPGGGGERDEEEATRAERVLSWLDELGRHRVQTPPTPNIDDDPPPQTDTALHVVYDGD